MSLDESHPESPISGTLPQPPPLNRISRGHGFATACVLATSAITIVASLWPEIALLLLQGYCGSLLLAGGAYRLYCSRRTPQPPPLPAAEEPAVTPRELPAEPSRPDTPHVASASPAEPADTDAVTHDDSPADTGDDQQTLHAAARQSAWERIGNRLLSALEQASRGEIALNRLLKLLATRRGLDFAVWFRPSGDYCHLEKSFGLTAESRQMLDAAQLPVDQFASCHSGEVEPLTLHGTSFYHSLTPADRRKLQRCWLIPLRDESRDLGWILTTSLVLQDGDREVQFALTTRAAAIVFQHLLRDEEQAATAHEQTTATEPALQPEPVTDTESEPATESEFGTASSAAARPPVLPAPEHTTRIAGPGQSHTISMLARFREQLRLPDLKQDLPLRRTALLMREHGLHGAWCTITCDDGIPSPGEDQETVSLATFERNLCELLPWGTSARVLDARAVSRAGGPRSVGSAITAPVTIGGRTAAILVLTSPISWRPTPQDQRLIEASCQAIAAELHNCLQVRSKPATGGAGSPPAETPGEELHTQLQLQVAELERDRELANASVKERDRLLATMSHEIRTPMNGILGMTELALRTDLNDEQREYLATVQSSSETLLALVNDLLEVSRIEAGHLKLRERPFPVRVWLQEVLRSISSPAADKHIELLFDIDSRIPPILVGDPDRLRQVIVNLAGNAVRFTDTGEVAVTVTLLEPPATMAAATNAGTPLDCEFTVRDTGIGIPRDQQDRLFEEYTQVEGTDRHQRGGTGLGLSISQRIVEQMGGKIVIDSEPGHGSTFRFHIALQPATDATVPDSASCSLPGITGNAPLVALRIHNAALRNSLAAALHRSGAKVAGAAMVTGAAKTAADEVLPQVIVVDVDWLEHNSLPPAGHGSRLILLRSGRATGQSPQLPHGQVTRSLLKPVDPDEVARHVLRVAAGEAPIARHDEEATTAPISATGTSTSPAGGLQVLVVDDHPVNRECALGLLRADGHTVHLAEDGTTALSLAATQSFDLILLDLGLPDVDGLEVARRLRQADTRTPDGHPTRLVALTGAVQQQVRAAAIRAGMNGFLNKPLRMAEFRELLQTAPADCHTPPAAAEQSGHPAVLNPPGGDLELASALGRTFLASCPPQLDSLQAALLAGDCATAESEAHSLKGAASCLGATALEELLYQIERQHGSTAPADPAETCRALDREFERLAEALNAPLPATSH